MRRIPLLALFVVMAVFMFAQGDTPKGVPAFNRKPPTKADRLPPILPKEQLWGANFQSPVQIRAYLLAAKLSSELHQMPCHCYCDRIGHKSLRSCYETTHASQCDACLKELYYISQAKKKGKTVAQIRQGIIGGQWRQIDLNAAAAAN
jgi:hypothetical protein